MFELSQLRCFVAVAEELHAKHCTHQSRQIPTSCNRELEEMYNSIDMTSRGVL